MQWFEQETSGSCSCLLGLFGGDFGCLPTPLLTLYFEIGSIPELCTQCFRQTGCLVRFLKLLISASLLVLLQPRADVWFCVEAEALNSGSHAWTAC